MDPAVIDAFLPFLAVGGGLLVALIWILKNPGKGAKLDKKMAQKLEAAYDENLALAERVKNLEYIVTSLDKDILRLHTSDLSSDEPSRQIEALKEEIKRLKSGDDEESLTVS